jgi:hypothetical protein
VTSVGPSPSNCAGPSLERHNLEAIRAAHAMEEHFLKAEKGTAVAARPQAWRVRDRIAPLARAWVAGQLATLQEWSDRIEANEDWRPAQTPRGCARYAMGGWDRWLSSSIPPPSFLLSDLC